MPEPDLRVQAEEGSCVHISSNVKIVPAGLIPACPTPRAAVAEASWARWIFSY